MSALHLDHAGLIVRDLAHSHAQMAALGFTLTARADHTMTNAQGQVVPAGSAQHSVMLESGYVELMQIIDPAAGHPLTPAIGVRFGMHILALGTDDAAATHAGYRALGQPIGPLRHWARPVQDGDRSGLARFAFFDAPWEARDPSYLCWVQHLTPDLIRPPGATVHANTATALAAVHYAGPPGTAAAWCDRLRTLGVPMRRRGATAELDLGNGRLRVTEANGLKAMVPVRLDLQVRSLDQVRACCTQANLTMQTDAEGAIVVDMQASLGIALAFLAV
jgi:catechol 2,3-dioxygenase-like lactoylglutathione lyase family enzyme